MTKPIVSKDFNLEDIRKIREYNSLRHVKMTPREIIEDTRKGAAAVLERLRQSEKVNVCFYTFSRQGLDRPAVLV